MVPANLVNATRATASGSMNAASIPTEFGVYVMSEPITVNPDTYLPPYVDEDRTGLHPSVSFYSVAGSATESIREMIPVDTRCYYSRSKLEYTLEYVKNNGAGIVRSIAIGRGHGTASNSYVWRQKDYDMPPDLYSSKVNYFLEHTADGTVLVKQIGTSDILSINLKTKLYNRETNASAFGNLTTQFGGLIVNGTSFKVAKKSASGSLHTVTLTYLKNCLTAAETANVLDIAVPTREGMAVATDVSPVLVARNALNRLEIFITMSVGMHSGQAGANIKKVVVDVSDLANITYDVVDLGIFKYAISNFGTTVGQYMTGLFHDNKYWLPYLYPVKASGVAGTAGIAAFQEGVVVSSDFAAVHNVINFRNSANVSHAPVVTDANEVIQMSVNTAAPFVVKIGQLISGANLENAITKGENDVLRVIYRYKII
jgi:hypothetical protein